jgi:hypothetical protein
MTNPLTGCVSPINFQFTGQAPGRLDLDAEGGISGKGHFFGTGMPVSLRQRRTLDSLYEQRCVVSFVPGPHYFAMLRCGLAHDRVGERRRRAGMMHAHH